MIISLTRFKEKEKRSYVVNMTMRAKEFIIEAAKKYEVMFQAFADANGQMPSWVKNRIRSVEALLKRHDRIVWALRYERYIAAQKSGNAKLIGKCLREITVSPHGIDRDLEEYQTLMRDHFPHWFSLGIAALEKYTFSRQSTEQVWQDWAAIEEKWKSERKQIINHANAYPETWDNTEEVDDAEDDGEEYYGDFERKERARKIEARQPIEKMIDFGDGWAWWNLNRTYCSTEGNAMGHCGNAPSAQPGDVVLSLRKDVGRGEFRPSLTFILHENGMLGEMKGRGNEKPKAAYHDMIIALLRSRDVRGIEGGGYQAAKNFSILDLPEAQRAPLLASKPQLLSVYDRIQLCSENPSEENRQDVIDAISRRIRSAGWRFDTIDFVKSPIEENGRRALTPRIIIHSWKNREAYARSYSAGYELSMAVQFFHNCADKLLEYDLDDEAKAERIAELVARDYFDGVFDFLASYSEKFYLDGVHLTDLADGRFGLVVPAKDFLTPTCQAFQFDDYDDEPDTTPILDRIGSFDSKEENDGAYNWSDISENCDLDELGQSICRYAVDQKDSLITHILKLVMDKYSEDDGDTFRHYHSDDPNQLSFDLK